MDRQTDRHRYIQRGTEIEREGRRKGWGEGEGGDQQRGVEADLFMHQTLQYTYIFFLRLVIQITEQWNGLWAACQVIERCSCYSRQSHSTSSQQLQVIHISYFLSEIIKFIKFKIQNLCLHRYCLCGSVNHIIQSAFLLSVKW